MLRIILQEISKAEVFFANCFYVTEYNLIVSVLLLYIPLGRLAREVIKVLRLPINFNLSIFILRTEDIVFYFTSFLNFYCAVTQSRQVYNFLEKCGCHVLLGYSLILNVRILFLLNQQRLVLEKLSLRIILRTTF